MDKVKVAKEIGKLVVSCGTSLMLGGIGGLGIATTTGALKIVAKISVPLACGVWTTILSKHSDPVVEETIDQVADVMSTAKTIIEPAKNKANKEN